MKEYKEYDGFLTIKLARLEIHLIKRRQEMIDKGLTGTREFDNISSFLDIIDGCAKSLLDSIGGEYDDT